MSDYFKSGPKTRPGTRKIDAILLVIIHPLAILIETPSLYFHALATLLKPDQR